MCYQVSGLFVALGAALFFSLCYLGKNEIMFHRIKLKFLQQILDTWIVALIDGIFN